jgi:hypothetical protein
MAGSCRREAKVDSSRAKGYCPESRPSTLATAGLRGIATARWKMHGRSLYTGIRNGRKRRCRSCSFRASAAEPVACAHCQFCQVPSVLLVLLAGSC